MKLAIAFLVETIDAAFRQLSDQQSELVELRGKFAERSEDYNEVRADLSRAVELIDRYRAIYGDLPSPEGGA